jgi:hypothetical protein
MNFRDELKRLADRDRGTDLSTAEGILRHYSTLGVDAREMTHAAMDYLRAGRLAWPDEHAKVALSLAGRMFEIGKMQGERYPYQDGDTTVIGPECFIAGKTISYKGQNYILRNGG